MPFCMSCGSSMEGRFCAACGAGGGQLAPASVRITSATGWPPGAKQRHGCLTLYLVLMMAGCAFGALVCWFGTALLRTTYPNSPDWAFAAIGLLNLVDIGFAVALFRWKKVGFLGICAVAVVTFLINLAMGLNALFAFFCMVLGLALLYGVLHIGNDRKGWTQLE
jgi:hypothetical protein